MARLLYTSDAVVGPPKSSLTILTAPPGTYSYKAIADLQSVDGRSLGGRVTTDQSGSLPDFFGPEGDVATLYALLPDGTTVTLSLAAENASPLTAADARGTYRPLAGSPPPPTFRPLIADYDMVVRATLANADIIRYTAVTRRRAVIVNNGTDTLNVVEGTAGVSTPPGSGYTAVAPGQQWETTSTLPVFGYFTTTAQTVRVYVEIGA